MSKLKDLTGMRFGMLKVIERAEDYVSPQGRKAVKWRCVCDCGNIVDISASHLSSGNNVSCGCYHKKRLSEDAKKNNTKHGMSRTRIYKEYRGMIDRCSNPNNPSYENYGGRGIAVCEEWSEKDGFLLFNEWASRSGYRDDLTIDRIDVNGGYSPSNCRWVDWEIQRNNTTKSVKLTYNGKTQSVAQWGREIGLDRHTILGRIKSGLTIEEVLDPKHRVRRKRKCAKRVN